MIHVHLHIEHSEQLRRELRVGGGGRNTKGETAGDALLRLAKLGEELRITGPVDLSTRVDDYLYGGK